MQTSNLIIYATYLFAAELSHKYQLACDYINDRFC